jgi:two-component system LytT family response regulator
MMSHMRVLVADDELVARKRLLRLLAAIEGVRVVGECETGMAVLERLKAKDVDVVLLDIHMPGLSGLETIALLPPPPFPEDAPVIILCTAHPDHAVEAFEHGAADYVMKPVEAGRLKKALARASERLASRRQSPAAPEASLAPAGERPRSRDGLEAPRGLDRLALPTRQGIVLLDPRAVSHAILEGELVSVVTEGGTYLSDDTLADLQEQLPRDLFERVHRRAILNLEHVERLVPLETGGFVAHTRGGHAVEVSRQAARELRRRLKVRG